MNIITIKELDHILDYVPVISTVSNLIDITAKLVLGNLSNEPIDSFPYFAHLSEKSYLRCVTLLIPIVGNIIVGLHDTIGNPFTELEDSALNSSPSNEFGTRETTLNSNPYESEEETDLVQQALLNSYKDLETHENQLASAPTTSRTIFNETTLNSNFVEKKIDVNSSQSEEEIDAMQQAIRDNLKEFENLRNQRSHIATTNAVNSNAFIQPVGINNTSKNCWCISVLQILCNTPLYDYVMSSDPNLQNHFPKLFEFIKIYREKPESSEQLGSKIKEIRIEINKHLGKQFSPSENEEGDAMKFIMELFEYLNLDYHLTGYLETRSEHINESIIALKQQCIFINPESIQKENLDIEDIFDSTPYEAVAVLRAEPAHYSSQIKAANGHWYQCNDHKISKKLTVFQSASVENDPSILIVGYRKN